MCTLVRPSAVQSMIDGVGTLSGGATEVFSLQCLVGDSSIATVYWTVLMATLLAPVYIGICTLAFVVRWVVDKREDATTLLEIRFNITVVMLIFLFQPSAVKAVAAAAAGSPYFLWFRPVWNFSHASGSEKNEDCTATPRSTAIARPTSSGHIYMRFQLSSFMPLAYLLACLFISTGEAFILFSLSYALDISVVHAFHSVGATIWAGILLMECATTKMPWLFAKLVSISNTLRRNSTIGRHRLCSLPCTHKLLLISPFSFTES